jgi:integrase
VGATGARARRLKVRRLSTPLIFHRAGEPVAESRKAWATACKRAGLPGILFHDLRRSAIRNMIRAGVDRVVAEKISGHRTGRDLRSLQHHEPGGHPRRDEEDGGLRVRAPEGAHHFQLRKAGRD